MSVYVYLFYALNRITYILTCNMLSLYISDLKKIVANAQSLYSTIIQITHIDLMIL